MPNKPFKSQTPNKTDVAETATGSPFKSYVCNEYPFLKLSSGLKDEYNRHITIIFGERTPGLYTARSAAEEEFIESRDWFGVKIFPFDQADAVQSTEK